MRKAVRVLVILLVPLFAGPGFAQREEVLIEAGSTMKYLPNADDPLIGLDWIAPGFDDSAWSVGTYGVGYGAGDLIATPVDPGTWSVYTRVEFTIDDVANVENLYLGADWDDGYVAWVNGNEVYRSPQMPAGDPLWNTGAGGHESSNGSVPDYGILNDITAAALPFLTDTGPNVLAIGAWNTSGTSSDLVLVPKLVLNYFAVDRGPYVQLATASSLIVRWRTTIATDSRVEYGRSPGALNESEDDVAVKKNHEIHLTGLSPDTDYFYSIGTSAAPIAGDDLDHVFRTAPAPGTRRPYRFWVIGDSGTANAAAAGVRDSYESFADGDRTDAWLMLGDNAYPSGTDAEYQKAVFEMYPDLLRKTVVWPTFGNHDAVSASSASETGPYYDIFSLPGAGEAGGMASGTESYYSFDFGNVHFVCVNSQDEDRTPGSTMLTWLAQDLASTAQDWIIAYWHHPPYSRGSHDSDSPIDSGGRLFDMRENVLPILEDWGVDLVFTGHSHSYERSMLLDGHYDVSTTLTEDMKLDAGDGSLTGDGAYQKTTAGPAGHEGTVYTVAGSSGLTGGGTLDHPAMVFSLAQLGSVVIDVDGDRLTTRFLDDEGAFLDDVTIVKNTGVPPSADFSASPLAGTVPFTVDFTDLSTTNTASWSWDLDGDGTDDSTEQNPSFLYDEPGAYTVHLTVANDSGSDQEIRPRHICASGGLPPNVTGLGFEAGGQVLSWDAVPLPGAVYDVVRGNLTKLRLSSGDFGRTDVICLESGEDDLEATDTSNPTPVRPYYYLARAVGCGIDVGSYDTGGQGQVASRDSGIDGSPNSCP